MIKPSRLLLSRCFIIQFVSQEIHWKKRYSESHTISSPRNYYFWSCLSMSVYVNFLLQGRTEFAVMRVLNLQDEVKAKVELVLSIRTCVKCQGGIILIFVDYFVQKNVSF